MNEYKNIDEYISSFPDDVQAILQQVRQVIRQAAPEAAEVISYGIPTFKLNGKNLVHFAGYSNHIGFYPGPQALVDFADQISGYQTSKGTVQFALNKPIPYDLIRKITEDRVLKSH